MPCSLADWREGIHDPAATGCDHGKRVAELVSHFYLPSDDGG